MFGPKGQHRRGWGRARMFRLLGAEARQRILDLLRGGPLPVGEIARRLGITQPAASQHLAALRDAGFVIDRRQGQHVFYELEPAAFCRYRLGARAFGLPHAARRDPGMLENYRDFLRAELERVERQMRAREEPETGS